jgi:tetratricopeptide (TPR) repeat protein
LDDASNLFLEARRALKAGDRAKAMELYTQSIDAKPYAWNLYERGKLYAEDGNEQAALADVTAGLAIDPQFEDLQWLQEELKKPKEQRLKTPPPSALH